MDNFKIQSLIAQGDIVTSSDIDPTQSYLQVGVYQQGNRQIGPSNTNTYKSYAIPLSEVGGGSGPVSQSVVFLKKTIDLTSGAVQSVSFPTTGLYIIDSAYMTNSNTDLQFLSNAPSITKVNLELRIPGTPTPLYKSYLIGPGAPIGGFEYLAYLISPDNFLKMPNSNLPLCFPGFCNPYKIYDGTTAPPIDLVVEVPLVGTYTVDVYIKLLRIA